MVENPDSFFNMDASTPNDHGCASSGHQDHDHIHMQPLKFVRESRRQQDDNFEILGGEVFSPNFHFHEYHHMHKTSPKFSQVHPPCFEISAHVERGVKLEVQNFLEKMIPKILMDWITV